MTTQNSSKCGAALGEMVAGGARTAITCGLDAGHKGGHVPAPPPGLGSLSPIGRRRVALKENVGTTVAPSVSAEPPPKPSLAVPMSSRRATRGKVK